MFNKEGYTFGLVLVEGCYIDYIQNSVFFLLLNRKTQVL